MRIVQVTQTLFYGDAIGNDIIALSKIINSLGYKSEIYAEFVHPPYTEKTAKHISFFPSLDEDDVVLYHFSISFYFTYDFAKLPCKKILVYHNITPTFFFKDNAELHQAVLNAFDEIHFLKNNVDYCLADSYFNKNDLINMGYECPIEVLPILMSKHEYEQKPDSSVFKKYNDGWTNIIFTGRIAPNKKQEDVIAAFCWYKKNINKYSRLFVVGRGNKNSIYYRRLRQFVKLNKIKDVIFTGHVQFAEYLAYYKCASLFLCMSEHEGFCVPIVEAMIFGLPIVAYDAAAVGETLGGGGLLIKDKDPVFVAKCMERILAEKELQTHFRMAQKKRLDDFSYEKVSKKFIDFINEKLKVGNV